MKLILSCILILSAQFLISCATKPTDTPVVVKPTERIAGSWENTTAPHPERKPWSDLMAETVRADLPIYDKAKDITEMCPKWNSLNDDKKVKGVMEFWIALAYYESGYNPKSSSVDVGSAGDRNSYSDGLYQLSGNDGAAQKYKCDYNCLHDPLKNITVALEQMRRQIVGTKSKYQGCGYIFLDNSSPCRYWAPTLKNNKYSKIPKIQERIRMYAPECK